jgi:hypothetical protein
MTDMEQSRYPTFPLIEVDELIDRFGVNTDNSLFPSADQAREWLGKELERAYLWIQWESGWDIEEDTIDSDIQSVIADCAYNRIGVFFWKRAASRRFGSDDAGTYRALANDCDKEAKALVIRLHKTKQYTRVSTYASTSGVGQVKGESDIPDNS